MDVPECVFRFETVDGWGRPVQMGDNSEIVSIKRWLEEGYNDIEWPATLKDIKLMLSKISGIQGSDRLQHYIVVARENQFIEEQPRDEMSKGQRVPKFYCNIKGGNYA